MRVRNRLTALSAHAPLGLAQGMTLVATLYPILAGRAEQIVPLLFTAGLSTILVYPATFAVAVRLPVSTDDQSARRVKIQSITLAAVLTSALLIAGVITLSMPMLSARLVYLAEFLIAQALYMTGQAEATRRLSARAIGVGRLIYAASSLVLTILVTHFLPTPTAFVAATSISFIASGIWQLVFSRDRENHDGSLPNATATPDVEMTTRSALILGLSLGAGNVAKQAPAVALPLLGPLSAAWATGTRLGNGFQTVGGSIFGPSIDIKFARAIRYQDGEAAGAALKQARRISIALALIAAVVTAAGALLFGHATLSFQSAVVLCISVAIVWASEAFVAPIGKTLSMLPGSKFARYGYDVLQVILCGLSLLIAREHALLLALATSSAIATMFYAVALRFRVTQLRSRWTDDV